MDKRPSTSLIIAAFASLYIIWGSTYIAIAIGLKTLPPFILAASRFILAGVLMYAWCKIKGEPSPSMRTVAHNGFAGILMLFFGTGSLVWAEQYVSSGVAAIVIATVPLWMVILDKQQWAFHFGNKLILAGLLVGFVGVIILVAGNKDFNMRGGKMQVISFFVLLFGALLWAAGSLYSRYSATEGSTTMKASLQMMGAGLVSIIPVFIAGEHHHFQLAQITTQTTLSVLYLVTFGSLIGYSSYIFLLGVRPSAQVGTYAYVNPVVAVFLGWLILGEQIHSRQLLALGIILAGVITVNLSKEKKPRPQS